jgi:hypothetical protein
MWEACTISVFFFFFAYSFWWNALRFVRWIARECWCGVCVCSFRCRLHVATHAGIAWRCLGKIITSERRRASNQCREYIIVFDVQM